MILFAILKPFYFNKFAIFPCNLSHCLCSIKGNPAHDFLGSFILFVTPPRAAIVENAAISK